MSVDKKYCYMQLKDAFFHSVEVAALEREEKEINNNAPAPHTPCFENSIWFRYFHLQIQLLCV